MCDTDTFSTCSSSNIEPVHSICTGYAVDAPYGGGSCVCGTTDSGGTGSACEDPYPICRSENFGHLTTLTRSSATCQVMSIRSHRFH